MFRRLFRLRATSPAQVEAELREEIEAHIALGVERLVQRGADPSDAERQVRARFGDLQGRLPTLVASAQRRSRTIERRERLGELRRDIRFGARQLRRSPGFTVGVLLSLGFGIGASATVFSWMEGLVLRPFPAVRDVDRLISVRPEIANGFGVSIPELEEWRAQSHTSTGLAGVSLSLFAVRPRETDGAAGRPVYGMFVSANYFDILGVRPALGRFFASGDDAPGSAPTAVISDALWRHTLEGAPDAVGRTIRVNGYPVRVIGVAPANFGGTVAAAQFDLWVGLSVRPLLAPADAARWRERDFRWLDVIGRLRDGTSLHEAHAEFSAIGRRQAAEFVENRGRGVRAIPLDVGTAKQLQPLLVALVVVTGLVILLVCSNVANLLLARAARRHRELAVRLAIGASRFALVRQLMVESVLLAAAGATLGAGLAAYGHRLLAVLMPTSSVTIGAQSGIDLRFAAFVTAITGAAVLAFGLAPALVGSRVDVAETMKNGARGSAAHDSRVRTGLVVAQFAIALSALVCAALFLRRDRNVRAMDFGLRDTQGVLLVQMEMSTAGYRDVNAWERTVDRALARVSTLPGVRDATVGSFVPLGFLGYTRSPVEVPGHYTESGVPDRLLVNGVAAGYFDLMRLPILAGRAITADDLPGRQRVAVVNEAFVSAYFGGRSPLGRTFTLGGDSLTVVGVTRNGKYDYRAIDEPPPPFVYYAWKQAPSNFVTLHVRALGDPLALVSSVRGALLAVDPDLTLLAPVTLAEYASVPFFPSRSALMVLTVLGAAALLLASMGLFSVISYGVAARTREVGIRVALGATPARVVGMFLNASLALVAAGLSVGAVAAVAFTAILRSRLPLLPAGDVREYLIPALVLAASAIAAGLIPARRAAGIDPARTLREE